MNLTEKMSEREFGLWLEDACRKLGWRYYHTFDARHSTAGFPDYVLVRERVIYAELKSERGKLTAAQEGWHQDLAKCGQQVETWRPSDMDHILALLIAKYGGKE